MDKAVIPGASQPALQLAVSVIIPTMASPQRASLLKRAVYSIRSSSKLPIQIIVVVNGKHWDEGVCKWLQAQPDVRFEYIEHASSPLAILRGRELVQSSFFATLDDDDEFLEEGIDQRLKVLQSDLQADLVVTNGFKRLGNRDYLAFPDFDMVAKNPLQALMDFGWLNSGNTLYRSASIDCTLFSDSHPYAEWTWLAYRLALRGHRIAVLDQPTFRLHDTPASLSKSGAYNDAYFSLYEKMLACSPPPEIAKAVRRKRGAAWHTASSCALGEGDWLLALKLHLKSLTQPAGLQYLSYSRHFLSPRD